MELNKIINQKKKRELKKRRKMQTIGGFLANYGGI